MPSLTMHFKNCPRSKALEAYARELVSEIGARASSPKLIRVQATVSQENGPWTPGADVYGCAVVALLSSGRVLTIRQESAWPYDAVTKAIGGLERSLSEAKRARVAMRNDRRWEKFAP